MNGEFTSSQAEKAENLSRLAGLILVVLSLLFPRGTYVWGLALLAFALVLRKVGPERPVRLALEFWVAVVCAFYFWLTGLLPNFAAHASEGNALLFSAILIASFGFPVQVPVRWLEPRVFLGPLMIAFVLGHLVGDFFFQGPPHRRFDGLFSNIHYLSGYVVLTLPVLMVLILRAQGWLRILLCLALLLDLGLLLASRSRPGFMALGASVLMLVPFLEGASRWRLLLSAGVGFGFLYFLNPFEFATKIQDFLAHVAEDERAEIWSGTLEMLKNNSMFEWVFGHGLGQFLVDYHDLSLIRQTKVWVSPHNFVLEILYSHGISGLCVFFATMFWLFRTLIRRLSDQGLSSETRTDGLMLISMLTAVVTHGFFTIPFFSRDFLLPFALLVGWSLRTLHPR